MALNVLIVSATPQIDLPPWSAEDAAITICSPPPWVSRAAMRVGPLRLSPGRWAAAIWLQRSPRAAEQVAAADLVVSADELTRPAVWFATRRRGIPGVDGLTAATMYIHGDGR